MDSALHDSEHDHDAIQRDGDGAEDPGRLSQALVPDEVSHDPAGHGDV
jgi:hypothetical protein